MSQRDLRTFDALLSLLDPSDEAPVGRVDHHETGWYREAFGD
jgi:hypothetical protein